MKTRMDFVEKWAEFVVNHSPQEWGKIQAEFLDSQYSNAEHIKLTKEQVYYIKQKK